MTRLPLLLAVALLVSTVPAASAQQAAYGLEIEGLDAHATNRSVANLPFEVTLTVQRAPCLGQASSYVVDLAASADAGNGSVDAQVLPAQLRFSFGPTETLVSASKSESAVLEVARGAILDQRLNATVGVTATLSQVVGCTGGSASGSAAADATITFEPGGPDSAPVSEPGAAMPGLPGAVLVLAVLALAALARRR